MDEQAAAENKLAAAEAAERSSLNFLFREKRVPVSFETNITLEQAQQALESSIFREWRDQCYASDLLDIRHVLIQSVDFFGQRGVGFLKVKASVYYLNDSHQTEHSQETTLSQQLPTTSTTTAAPLPGICFLRGNAVCIFVVLVVTAPPSNDSFTEEGQDSYYAVLVEQPRVPVGQAACLELPAGMMDDTTQTFKSMAVQELQEECHLSIKPEELVDLTQLAFPTARGLAPSPGGCDEHVRCLYTEQRVSRKELNDLQDRQTGLRDHGEYITLKIVPLQDAWKVSQDMKVMVSLFLQDRLRSEGKLPPLGEFCSKYTNNVR